MRIIAADDRTARGARPGERSPAGDLGAIEEARGYRRMMEEYGMTQAEVAGRVSKSRPLLQTRCGC